MANKKKQANPGTVQFKRLFAELPEKRKILKHKLNLDMNF